jgi:glc operon protein GlcG
VKSRPALTAADADRLLAAARAEAEGRRLEVTIAIVDEAGILLALHRLDGARLHTPEAAWLKARTAAITRQPTEDLQAAVPANPALLSFPGRMPLTGGLPLVVDGVTVGGVGSSGGEPNDDVAVCAAAVAALTSLS